MASFFSQHPSDPSQRQPLTVGLVSSLSGTGRVGPGGQRPVCQLTSAIEHVIETRDFQPVVVPDASGEVARLVVSFN